MEKSTGIITDNLALTVANAVPARLIALEYITKVIANKNPNTAANKTEAIEKSKPYLKMTKVSAKNDAVK